MENENNIETQAEQTGQTNIPETVQPATEPTQKKSKALMIFAIVAISFVVVVFLFFSFFALMAPYQKAEAFQKKYAPKTENKEAEKQKNIEMLSLENEIAFQRSDISLSKGDSIYLLIDLVDSVIGLELQGVSLQESKIVDFEVSNFLKKLDPQILNNYISKPFKVKQTESSVEKMKIKTKVAPKSEAEADAQKDTIPSEKDFVRFTWYFDRDLMIEFVQDSIAGNENYSLINKKINTQQRFNKLKTIMGSGIHLKHDTYTPYIKIVLTQNDALTVIRSTPVNGYVALRLGFKGMTKVSSE
jgi:hypothetical protein